MILDSSKKFVALEYSNPEEKLVIDKIASFIFRKKQTSVEKCGSQGNISFATNLNYLFFLLTLSQGLDDIQIDHSGKVIDPRLDKIYKYMKKVRFLELITSYCLLRDTPLCIQIWDVCIFSERRGTGIGNLLISNAVTLSPKNFWLVVLPDNTPAATLYIKNGFSIHNITQTDPSGAKISDKDVISMIYDKKEPRMSIDDNMEKFKIFSDRILGFVKIETLNIKIDREIINFFDSIIKNPSISYQVGGCFLTKHNDRFNAVIEYKDSVPYIVLGIHKNIIRGEETRLGGSIIEYNFMFISKPSSYDRAIHMPSASDMTVCTQTMIFNIVRLIKTQKFFIFYFDCVISINISPDLTEFILEVLDKSILSLDHLVACFNNLTTITMAPVYEKSFNDNNQIITTLLLQGSSPESFHDSIRHYTSILTCSFLNRICVKDLIDSDSTGAIYTPLLEFFKRKGWDDPSSISIFCAEDHKIHENARSEGLYISCENTVVPRNFSELKYSDRDMIDLNLLSRDDLLSRLTDSQAGTLFVLQ